MKEIVQTKINEYLHDLEKNDQLEDDEDIKMEKEKIQEALEKLANKMNEYNKMGKVLEDSGINEINFTGPDAKTVKFGAHQGTDVGYNVQAAVDSKNKLIATLM